MDQDENGGGVDRELDGRGEQELDNENAEATVDEIGNDNNNDSSSMTPTFGSLRQRPARALDSRAAFLRGMPSYILYYWEVADSQQLLSLSLQQLSNHANAADASSTALVSRRGATASVRSNISGGSSRSDSRRRNTGEETDDDEMTKIL